MEDIEKTEILEEAETVTAPGREQKNTADKKRRRSGNVIAAIVLCLVTVWWIIGAPFFDFGWSHLPSTNTCNTESYGIYASINISTSSDEYPDLLFDWKKSVIEYSESDGIKEVYTCPLRVQLTPINFDMLFWIEDWSSEHKDGTYIREQAKEMREHNVATWVYFEPNLNAIMLHYFLVQDNGELYHVIGAMNKEGKIAFGGYVYYEYCGNQKDFYDYVESNGK